MSLSYRVIYIFVSTTLYSLWSPQWAHADVNQLDAEAESNATPPPAAQTPVTMAADLSTKTDTELTALTAQWGSLNPGERRRLLAEVRGRMAANQNQKARRPIGVRVQRRYGRVVRKSDGSVVVETRVVQMGPGVANRSEGAAPRARVTFGIGFEQRSKSRRPPLEAKGQSVPGRQQEAPAITVSQQPTPPPAP